MASPAQVPIPLSPARQRLSGDPERADRQDRRDDGASGPDEQWRETADRNSRQREGERERSYSEEPPPQSGRRAGGYRR